MLVKCVKRCKKGVEGEHREQIMNNEQPHLTKDYSLIKRGRVCHAINVANR